MESEQSLSMQDLRSHAVEQQRSVDKRKKWHPKFGNGDMPVQVDPNNEHKKKPPMHHLSQLTRLKDRYSNQHDKRRLALHRKQNPLASKVIPGGEPPAFRRKQDVVGDYGPYTQDSSTDDDASYDAPSPYAEDDIKYSFDARRGPSEGNEILGIALNKAVAKFEDRQTAKLVNEEYEVLDHARNIEGYVSDPGLDDADDYEWV